MKITILAIATLFASVAITPFTAHAQNIGQLNPGDNLPALETNLRNANGRKQPQKRMDCW